MVVVGEVNFRREIVFSLILHDKNGDTHEVPAILDTGFEGYLTIPPLLAEALSLDTEADTVTVILGDGTERPLPIYIATLIWFGQEKEIRALGADTFPLIGQRLVEGCTILYRCLDGGEATIYSPI